NRAACQSNLRQIGVATHNLHEHYRVLPPLCAPNATTALSVPGPFKGAVGFTVFHWLLPFVEEDTVFQGLDPHATDYSGIGRRIAIPCYLCPSDASSAGGMSRTANQGANIWGAANYAANYFVFGNPSLASTEGANRIPQSFPDGVSNTIFYAEK